MENPTRTIRIMQSADDVFYIQEYKEFHALATWKTVKTKTGRWPFTKVSVEEIKTPCFDWVTWRDYIQPKVRDFTETMRHPAYKATTIDEARDHAKKVLADAIKFPVYHEI